MPPTRSVLIDAVRTAGTRVTTGQLSFASGVAYTAPYGRVTALMTLTQEPTPISVFTATDFSGMNASQGYGFLLLRANGVGGNKTATPGYLDYYPPIWRVDPIGRADNGAILDFTVSVPPLAGPLPPIGQSQWATTRYALFAVTTPFNVLIIPPDQWYDTVTFTVDGWFLPAPMETWLSVGTTLFNPARQSRYLPAGIAAGASTPAMPQNLHPLGFGIGVEFGNNPPPVNGTAVQVGLSGRSLSYLASIYVMKEDAADDIEVITYQNVGPNHQPAGIIAGIQTVTTDVPAGTRGTELFNNGGAPDPTLGYASQVRNKAGVPTAGGIWFIYNGPLFGGP